MRRLVSLLAVVIALIAPRRIVAQSDAPVVYMMYMTADIPDVPRWIERFRSKEVPILDSLKKEGRLVDYTLWQLASGGKYNLKYSIVMTKWDDVDDFMQAFYGRLGEQSTQEWLSMIRDHSDEIWRVGERDIPEGRASSPIVVESTFQIDYGKQGPWQGDLQKRGKGVLDRAMKSGPLRAYASLYHDTGGAWNAKYLYWLNDWDQVDDLMALLGPGGTGTDMSPEVARSVRAHSADVWRVVTR